MGPIMSAQACRFRILAVLGIALACIGGAAPARAQGWDLDKFPKHDLDEIPEKYRKWVVEEVGWIITDDEYDIFIRLGGEAQYERFVEEFWKQRDVTPGTPRNEYKELHYERLAYATKYYGRGTATPGWRTDRGRMHILIGEPQMKTRIPGEMLVYPLEVWFYAADPDLGIPSFFYLMFFQRNGGGDYRLYSPLSDGPEKLFNGAGVREIEVRNQSDRPLDTFAPTGYGDLSALISILREIDVDLAHAAISYYPDEGGMEFGISPLRSEMLIADIESLPERAMPDATWAVNVLTGVTESDVRFETLDLTATAVPLIDIDGQPFIHFATQTAGQYLNVTSYEDKYYFSFVAAGSVTDAEKRVLQSFEANLSGEMEEEQARRFTSNPFVYMEVLPTVPGRQTLDLTLENPVARSFGQVAVDLDVPSIHPERVTIVGPLLCAALQQAPQYDPFAQRFPFQYRDVVFIPDVDAVYGAGDTVSVLEQVLLPEGFSGSVTARYDLADSSGSTVREGAEVLGADLADEHGVIIYVWEIDTAGLPLGDYRIRLSVDENAAANATAELSLAPAPEGEPRRPFVNAQPAPPAADIAIAMERARQYRRVGDIEAALQWLATARKREPDDPEVQALTLELLKSSGRHRELIEVLTPLAARDPRDPELMLALARAHAELGEHYDAIRFYERARAGSGTDTVEILNALAAEYDAEGRPDKARELLQRSLEIDDDQPEIRQMLARLGQTIVEPQR